MTVIALLLDVHLPKMQSIPITTCEMVRYTQYNSPMGTNCVPHLIKMFINSYKALNLISTFLLIDVV